MKTCTHCGGSGPFGRSKAAKDGLKSHCKKCCAEKQRAYAAAHPETWAKWAALNSEHLEAKDAARYASDPEAAKVRTRAWQLLNPGKFKTYYTKGNLKKYGLTPEDKQALLDKQGGKCAICSDPLTTGRTGMQIDHNHDTGKVRGLLCGGCNVMLGDFRENPVHLRRAIAYLEQPPLLRNEHGHTLLGGLTHRPKGLKSGTRASNLWYGYGLTPDSFQAVLDSQCGACGICREPLKAGQGTHIDHNHKIGRKAVRGLLCRPCNLGLGHAREDAKVLRNAAGYLLSHGT